MSTSSADNELHVIFGTGAVGTALMRELLARGRRVRMINRGGHAPEGAPGAVEVVAGDAYDPAFARRAAAGAAVVYQCAQPAYHAWATMFMPLQTSILQGAAAAGAKLIAVENLYMYGDPDGEPLTEDSPERPVARKGRVRKEMADALKEAHRAGLARTAAVRPANFFGPGYALFAEQVVYPALAGKTATATGALDVPHTFSYTGDVARALAVVGERDDALGAHWHVPSPAPLTQRDLLAAVFRAADHAPRARAVGPLMMRAVGLLVPGARETVEMMYEFQKPFVMDSARFQRQFGLRPTPIDEAVRETVAYCRAHPQGKKGH